MVDKHKALDRDEILTLLASYTGITTTDGATPGNNTLVDSALMGKNDFITNKTVLIGPGSGADYEDRAAIGFAPLTGTITVSSGFSAQIKNGTLYWILNTSSAALLAALLNTILARIGDPSAHTLNSLTAKWGDIARSLDLILGNRWDAAGDLGTDIATIIAAVGGGDGGTVINITTMLTRPRIELYEGWQDEAGIDAALWTVTNPATGAAWARGADGPDLMASSTPNANENARIRSNQRWVAGPTLYGTNKILRRFMLEFELQLANEANFDNANFFLGLTPAVGNTRASNNIIGLALVGAGNALQTVTNNGGVETVNTGFGETLANKNKLKIDIYLNHVKFYLNQTLIADHAANLPDAPMYLNFYAPTGAGGAATIKLGIVRAWTEDVIT